MLTGANWLAPRLGSFVVMLTRVSHVPSAILSTRGVRSRRERTRLRVTADTTGRWARPLPPPIDPSADSVAFQQLEVGGARQPMLWHGVPICFLVSNLTRTLNIYSGSPWRELSKEPEIYNG